MLALIAALWAYDGWNDLTMVAGEVRRPERSLPIALIGGLFIVGVLFMATNAAIQYILPAAQIAASNAPPSPRSAIVAGPRGRGFVSAGMALSIFVTLNGTVMSGARIPFAAARDGLFFRQFAHIHPRFQTPSTSLIVQGSLTTVLLLFLSRFQQLFELAIFAEWLFYMLTATTVFVYRRRHPEFARPYRVWGYPLLPALFVVCAAVVLVWSTPATSGAPSSAPPSSSSASPYSGSFEKSTARDTNPAQRQSSAGSLLSHSAARISTIQKCSALIESRTSPVGAKNCKGTASPIPSSAQHPMHPGDRRCHPHELRSGKARRSPSNA